MRDISILQCWVDAQCGDTICIKSIMEKTFVSSMEFDCVVTFLNTLNSSLATAQSVGNAKGREMICTPIWLVANSEGMSFGKALGHFHETIAASSGLVMCRQCLATVPETSSWLGYQKWMLSDKQNRNDKLLFGNSQIQLQQKGQLQCGSWLLQLLGISKL